MEEKKPKPRTPKPTENVSPKLEETTIPQINEVNLEEDDKALTQEEPTYSKAETTMEEYVTNLADFLNQSYS